MSNTYHHGNNFDKIPHKNRAAGYEYWSSRFPYPLPAGRFSKKLTARRERKKLPLEESEEV